MTHDQLIREQNKIIAEHPRLRAENTRLLAENERLRKELAATNARHVHRAGATEALALKAYTAALNSAGLVLIPGLNIRANEDVRRGFWAAAYSAGLSIDVIARVSHAHHMRVSRFNTTPVNPTTLAYRNARDAARKVFKEAAAA